LQPIFEEVQEVILAPITKTTNTMKIFFILNQFCGLMNGIYRGRYLSGMIANSSTKGLETQRSTNKQKLNEECKQKKNSTSFMRMY
jgi:hypothetical protein